MRIKSFPDGVCSNVADAKSWPEVIVVARGDVRGERRTWCVGMSSSRCERARAYLSWTQATSKVFDDKLMSKSVHNFRTFFCVFFPFASKPPPQFVEHETQSSFERTLSKNSSRHGAFSLSLSLLFAFKLASSYFESSSRFARTKEFSTHRARGRADAVVAWLGFVVARARWRFFPSVWVALKIAWEKMRARVSRGTSRCVGMTFRARCERVGCFDIQMRGV